MTRHVLLTGWILLLGTVASAQTPDQLTQLARARTAFNQGQMDQAIAAAVEARKVPALQATSSVVLGRAYVERYLQKSDAADLMAAHDVFSALNPERLAGADRGDFTIGLGLTVFFEGRPGAAAELLEVALTGSTPAATTVRAREKLFDWWATAVDRAAQLTPDAGRRRFYERIVERSEAELARDPYSAAAGYWLAAGARGASELDRAWHAAIAAWIRAKVDSARGNDKTTDARADIDMLVTTAIIPERARALDPHAALALISAMRAEWEQIKTSW